MPLELRVWGPAFGLASIDPECLAAIAYCRCALPLEQWILIADYDASLTPTDEFPILVDGPTVVAGYADIVSYLQNSRSGSYNLDAHLSQKAYTDSIAFSSFLKSTAGPLIDLSLFVSSENYNATTSAAYTAILPWYLNYIIPPRRRDLARSRTTHMGLSSLDVSPGTENSSSDFNVAKRDAGIPGTGGTGQPKVLSMGRAKGLQGILSSPVYAARFKLDMLTNELLQPLSDQLGDQEYLLGGQKPSSLDCLAFGFLALLLYPKVPQAWLREHMQSRFPRIAKYIERMRRECHGNADVDAQEVWSISAGKNVSAVGGLPWAPRPTRSVYCAVSSTARKVATNLPVLSSVVAPNVVVKASSSRHVDEKKSSLPSSFVVNTLATVSASAAIGLAAFAIHHRKSPREGDLVFWALRPASGFGEAGKILSVLAYPMSGVPAN